MDVLSQALTQGITPAVVVAIYLVVTKIIDNKRASYRTELSNNLINSINVISNFVIGLTKNIVDKDKEKCRAAIEDSMYSAGMRLVNFVSTTIINNNIETNKDNVMVNIHNIVNAEYYSVYSTLSLYNIDNVKISDILDKKWVEDVERDMIDIIYNTTISKEDKILAFSNKLNIRFQSYITYIINNSIKY